MFLVSFVYLHAYSCLGYEIPNVRERCVRRLKMKKNTTKGSYQKLLAVSMLLILVTMSTLVISSIASDDIGKNIAVNAGKEIGASAAETIGYACIKMPSIQVGLPAVIVGGYITGKIMNYYYANVENNKGVKVSPWSYIPKQIGKIFFTNVRSAGG